VVQAECARIEPEVEMNPVLLKPNSDVGCQVILMGKAEFNMDAVDYHAHKPQLVDTVMKAYNKLASEHQVIAIEGAGSPAEINLRDNDIVNMGLAELVEAVFLPQFTAPLNCWNPKNEPGLKALSSINSVGMWSF
jgi:adenosylcobyric acid synthase